MLPKNKDLEVILGDNSKHIALIFNSINHDSLLAAVLMCKILEETTQMRVDLVDIRDAIPDDAENYIWFDCGTNDDFKKYYIQAVVKHADPASHRSWCERVLGRSYRINPHMVQNQEPTDTTTGQMAERMLDINMIDENTYRQIMSLAALSHRFQSESVSSEDLILYHDLLGLALDVTLGRDHGLFSILNSIHWKPAPDTIEAFKERQKSINKRLVGKYREISAVGRQMYHITLMGHDVFGLIRRFTIAKKPFIHVSMGAYGQVLYSNIPIPNAYVAECGLLNLTPSIEVSKAV